MKLKRKLYSTEKKFSILKKPAILRAVEKDNENMQANSKILKEDIKDGKLGKAALHAFYVPKKDRKLMKDGKY